MTIEAPQLSPGTVIDGFTIGSSVRTRSGAATFEATDSGGAKVHFTAYAGSCFATPLVRERSLRELKQLQGVNTPEVAKVLACGKIDAEAIYEVTEPVEGEVVDALGAQAVADAAKIAGAVGDALLAAQRVGVIHRNLGPTTVANTPAGPKVFGFTVGEPQGGDAFGPLDTIAPEQAEGKVVDQRSLIYNLAALTHRITTGKPLFDGDPDQKIAAHKGSEPPAEVEPKLARALAKDPKARPMMLKQFVSELKGLGADGAQAAKPSKRGWTMFMDAADGGDAPAPAVAPAPTPSPAPTPAASPTPAKPAASPGAPAGGGEAKPSKRGWTMFMDAAEADGPAPAPGAAPTPAPGAAPTPAPSPGAANPSAPSPSPSPSAPSPAAAVKASPAKPSAPAPAGGGEAKPSKRGWTMFMDAEEGASPAASPNPAPSPSPAPSAPKPASSTPKPAAASAPTAPAGAETKPSKRGWTMFMDAADGESPTDGPSPAPATPAASPSPSPSTPAPATPAGGQAASPSTRGWTMFMDADEGGGQASDSETAQPAQPAAPAQPAQPAQPAAPAQPAQPAAPAQPAQPAQPSEPAAADGGAKPSTRGWTMFMEAPLPAKDGAAPQEDAAQPAPAKDAPAPQAPTQPAVDGASDAKGWTVFMDQSPFAGQTPGVPPTDPEQQTQTPAAEPGAAAADPRHAAAEAAAASAPRPGQGKTIVAGGLRAPTAPAGGGAPSESDTMYFKRGSAEPERVGGPGGGAATRADDAPVPAAASAPAQEAGRTAAPTGQTDSRGGPATGATPQPTSMAPMGRDAPVAAQTGGGGAKVGLVVGGIVIVVAIIVTLVVVL